MRTEDNLREALRPAVDETTRVERLYAQIITEAGPTAHRRRPVLLLVAAVLVLVVVAGLALNTRSREAAPVETPSPTLTPTSSPSTRPGDRLEGYRRMVHRVDPPPDWKVVDRDLKPEYERTELSGPSGRSCEVVVAAEGFRPSGPAPSGVPEKLDGVTVDGRPAYRYPGNDRVLLWFPFVDAVGEVTCDSLEMSRMMAQHVVFKPSSLRAPVRLRQLPKDYRVDELTELADGASPAAVYSLIPAVYRRTPPSVESDLESIEILVAEGEPTVQDYQQDRIEQTTIAGYPALVDPVAGSLDLDVGRYRILIDYQDRISERWTPDERQRLVGLAEDLELAPDLGDRNTWFDAEDAIPS